MNETELDELDQEEDVFAMHRYQVIYIYSEQKRGFITTAHDIFEAEENFKIWAKDLDGSVKIKKTERIDE